MPYETTGKWYLNTLWISCYVCTLVIRGIVHYWNQWLTSYNVWQFYNFWQFFLSTWLMAVGKSLVDYNVCLIFFSVNIKVYSKGLVFLSCFIKCKLIYFSRGGKFEILITVPLFQNEQFFLDFSIMSLFKLLIKFLCCFVLIASILLLHIYTVITYCKFVSCI